MTANTFRQFPAALALVALSATASAQSATSIVSSPAAMAKARADSARYPYTTADVEFMQGMIHHHAQAIEMSKMAPTHNAGPAVQKLAARIINAQTDEIRLMSFWLADRNQEVPAPTAGPMKMKMNGTEMMMLMPGMLSEEQMKELDAARGTDFDKLFLKYMMQHHKGATGMVKTLFDTYGAGQDEMIFKFASDVNIDQTTEINRMYQLLSLIEIGLTP